MIPMDTRETPDAARASRAEDEDADHTHPQYEDADHTHPEVVHSHRHNHVFHHPAKPGIFVQWDHRSYLHSHEHNHSEMTHSHKYKQEDEEEMHTDEAHVHDHAAPSGSSA
jgi:hypothetical protein